MRFEAKEYLPLKHFIEFIKVLVGLGHTIVSTGGFKMDFVTDAIKARQNKTFQYISGHQAKLFYVQTEAMRERRPHELLMKLNNAAAKIQQAFRESISNPSYKMCRNRLMREFEELNLESIYTIPHKAVLETH